MPRTTSRLVELDVLRALAVLLVFGHHNVDIPKGMPPCITLFFSVWERAGYVGVDLFFVLSGFLIGGLLFTEWKRYQSINIGRFYLRRGLKIYPAFYTLLITTLVVRHLLHLPTPTASVLSEATFVQNYGPAIWNHTWSLGVEEHFYLLLPAGLLLCTNFSKNRSNPFSAIPSVFLAVALIILLLRLATNWAGHYNSERSMYPTHLRLDALFFGVVLSYYYHFFATRFQAMTRWRYCLALLWMIPILITITCGRNSFFNTTIGLTINYLAFGMLVVFTLTAPAVKRIFQLRPFVILASIGTYSYSIYLWHMIVRTWGLMLLHRLVPSQLPFIFESGFYMLTSIAIGVLMAKIIEIPVLSVRDRLFPSRSCAIQSVNKSCAGPIIPGQP